jgi:hypothetical protein
VSADHNRRHKISTRKGAEGGGDIYAAMFSYNHSAAYVAELLEVAQSVNAGPR